LQAEGITVDDEYHVNVGELLWDPYQSKLL
jgi:hypothetical protein